MIEYSTHNGIEYATPVNDENVLYLFFGCPVSELIAKIKEHFGDDANLDNFNISPEYIHTSCLSYDRYDPSDYQNFLVITRIEQDSPIEQD